MLFFSFALTYLSSADGSFKKWSMTDVDRLSNSTPQLSANPRTESLISPLTAIKIFPPLLVKSVISSNDIVLKSSVDGAKNIILSYKYSPNFFKLNSADSA